MENNNLWKKIVDVFKSALTGQEFCIIDKITKAFGEQTDLKKRVLRPACSQKGWILLYLESMAGEKILEESVIKPLVEWGREDVTLERVRDTICVNPVSEKLTDFESMIQKLLNGYCLVFEESNKNVCVCFDTRFTQMRN